MAQYHYSKYSISETYSNFRNDHVSSTRKTTVKLNKGERYREIAGIPYACNDDYEFHEKSDAAFSRGYSLCLFYHQSQYPLAENIESGTSYHYVTYDGFHVYVYYITGATAEWKGYPRTIWTRIETHSFDYDTTYSKGSYIGDVIAESGTYPDNGESGGYWYVKGSRVNTAPSTPSSISVPSDLKEGNSFQISWGNSYDAEGNSITYKLERSINGGSYAQMYSGNSRHTYDTPQASWNTVCYRVRAYDGSLYSGYKGSSTVEVKHFPEFKMCVNGELKTSADGWVKINGALRKIESIKVKVDGALKEV